MLPFSFCTHESRYSANDCYTKDDAAICSERQKMVHTHNLLQTCNQKNCQTKETFHLLKPVWVFRTNVVNGLVLARLPWQLSVTAVPAKRVFNKHVNKNSRVHDFLREKTRNIQTHSLLNFAILVSCIKPS